MNLSMIAYIVGAVMEIEAGLMLLPALVGLIYGEKSALSFVICAAAAAIIGAIPILRKPKNTAIYAREGFVATALSWLTLTPASSATCRLCRKEKPTPSMAARIICPLVLE